MFKRATVALFTVLLFALQADGRIVTYGRFVGVDFMFTDVFEDTRDATDALYGPPMIVGNTLDFDPINFGAIASSGTGTSNTTMVNGQLNFALESMAAAPISLVRFTEGGDYSLTGLGVAQATASVFAPVQWTITHVDGNLLTDPLSGSDMLSFTPDQGVVSLPGDLGTGVFWDGELDVNIASFAAANGITGNVTRVEFSIENQLTATASDGGSAGIFKKDFAGLVIQVPEPGTLCLLCVGILALPLLRRIRS